MCGLFLALGRAAAAAAATTTPRPPHKHNFYYSWVRLGVSFWLYGKGTFDFTSNPTELEIALVV